MNVRVMVPGPSVSSYQRVQESICLDQGKPSKLGHKDTRTESNIKKGGK